MPKKLVTALQFLVVIALMAGLVTTILSTKRKTNPSSFAGCSCAAAGTCQFSYIGNDSCDLADNGKLDGSAGGCCTATDPNATPPTQGNCVSGTVGGVCSGKAQKSCGGDLCEAVCNGYPNAGHWVLDGNHCTTPGDICDNSCAGNTCTGQTCTNTCGGILSGTKNCTSSSTPTPNPTTGPTPTPTTQTASAAAVAAKAKAVCDPNFGLCPAIDPVSGVVTGWVPATQPVYCDYNCALAARMNVVVANAYNPITISGVTYQAYDWRVGDPQSTQALSLSALTPAEVAAIKQTAAANQVGVTSTGFATVNLTAAQITDLNNRVAAFNTQQQAVQTAILTDMNNNSSKAATCANSSSLTSCLASVFPNYQWLTPANQTTVTTNFQTAFASQAASNDRINQCLNLLKNNQSCSAEIPGITAAEITTAQTAINDQKTAANLAAQYQSGATLTPAQIDTINRYFKLSDLTAARDQNLASKAFTTYLNTTDKAEKDSILASLTPSQRALFDAQLSKYQTVSSQFAACTQNCSGIAQQFSQFGMSQTQINNLIVQKGVSNVVTYTAQTNTNGTQSPDTAGLNQDKVVMNNTPNLDLVPAFNALLTQTNTNLYLAQAQQQKAINAFNNIGAHITGLSDAIAKLGDIQDPALKQQLANQYVAQNIGTLLPSNPSQTDINNLANKLGVTLDTTLVKEAIFAQNFTANLKVVQQISANTTTQCVSTTSLQTTVTQSSKTGPVQISSNQSCQYGCTNGACLTPAQLPAAFQAYINPVADSSNPLYSSLLQQQLVKNTTTYSGSTFNNPTNQTGTYTDTFKATQAAKQELLGASNLAITSCLGQTSACLNKYSGQQWVAYYDLSQKFNVGLNTTTFSDINKQLAAGQVDPIKVKANLDTMLANPIYSAVWNLNQFTMGFAGPAYAANNDNLHQFEQLTQQSNSGIIKLVGSNDVTATIFLTTKLISNLTPTGFIGNSIYSLIKPDDKINNISNSFTSNSIMGGAIPAATAVGVVAIPLAAAFAAPTAVSGLFIPTFLALSGTGLGISGTTQSLANTAYYCNYQPQYQGVLDNGQCAMARGNTIFMAGSTFLGIVAANPAVAANIAISNAADADQALAILTAIKSTPPNPILGPLGSANAAIGTTVFSKQAYDACISGDVVNCFANTTMAVGSLLHLGGSVANLFSSDVKTLTTLGVLSSKSSQAGGLLYAVSSCVGAQANAGNCANALAFFVIGSSGQSENQRLETLGQIKDSYLEAQQNFNTAKVQLAADPQNPVLQKSMLSATQNLANWNATLSIILRTETDLQNPAGPLLEKNKSDFVNLSSATQGNYQQKAVELLNTYIEYKNWDILLNTKANPDSALAKAQVELKTALDNQEPTALARIKVAVELAKLGNNTVALSLAQTIDRSINSLNANIENLVNTNPNSNELSNQLKLRDQLLASYKDLTGVDHPTTNQPVIVNNNQTAPPPPEQSQAVAVIVKNAPQEAPTVVTANTPALPPPPPAGEIIVESVAPTAPTSNTPGATLVENSNGQVVILDQQGVPVPAETAQSLINPDGSAAVDLVVTPQTTTPQDEPPLAALIESTSTTSTPVQTGLPHLAAGEKVVLTTTQTTSDGLVGRKIIEHTVGNKTETYLEALPAGTAIAISGTPYVKNTDGSWSMASDTLDAFVTKIENGETVPSAGIPPRLRAEAISLGMNDSQIPKTNKGIDQFIKDYRSLKASADSTSQSNQVALATSTVSNVAKNLALFVLPVATNPQSPIFLINLTGTILTNTAANNLPTTTSVPSQLLIPAAPPLTAAARVASSAVSSIKIWLSNLGQPKPISTSLPATLDPASTPKYPYRVVDSQTGNVEAFLPESNSKLPLPENPTPGQLVWIDSPSSGDIDIYKFDGQTWNKVATADGNSFTPTNGSSVEFPSTATDTKSKLSVVANAVNSQTENAQAIAAVSANSTKGPETVVPEGALVAQEPAPGKVTVVEVAPVSDPKNQHLVVEDDNRRIWVVGTDGKYLTPEEQATILKQNGTAAVALVQTPLELSVKDQAKIAAAVSTTTSQTTSNPVNPIVKAANDVYSQAVKVISAAQNPSTPAIQKTNNALNQIPVLINGVAGPVVSGIINIITTPELAPGQVTWGKYINAQIASAINRFLQLNTKDNQPGIFNVDSGASTDIGGPFTKYSDNQDYVTPDGVFDGVGGHGDGAKASQLVGKAVQTDLDASTSHTPKARIMHAVDAAQLALQQAIAKGDLAQGAASTGTFAVTAVEDGQTVVYVGNVGDSKNYLIRNNKLIPITTDQEYGEVVRLTQLQSVYDAIKKTRYAAYIVNAFGIDKTNDGYLALSRAIDVINQEIAAKYPNQGSFVITPQGWPVQITRTVILPGDKILRTSDGLPDLLTDQEMVKIVNNSSSAKQAANSLIKAAVNKTQNVHGDTLAPKTVDNLSAHVMLFAKSGFESTAPEPPTVSGDGQTLLEKLNDLAQSCGLPPLLSLAPTSTSNVLGATTGPCPLPFMKPKIPTELENQYADSYKIVPVTQEGLTNNVALGQISPANADKNTVVIFIDGFGQMNRTLASLPPSLATEFQAKVIMASVQNIPQSYDPASFDVEANLILSALRNNDMANFPKNVIIVGYSEGSQAVHNLGGAIAKTSNSQVKSVSITGLGLTDVANSPAEFLKNFALEVFNIGKDAILKPSNGGGGNPLVYLANSINNLLRVARKAELPALLADIISGQNTYRTDQITKIASFNPAITNRPSNQQVVIMVQKNDLTSPINLVQPAIDQLRTNDPGVAIEVVQDANHQTPTAIPDQTAKAIHNLIDQLPINKEQSSPNLSTTVDNYSPLQVTGLPENLRITSPVITDVQNTMYMDQLRWVIQSQDWDLKIISGGGGLSLVMKPKVLSGIIEIKSGKYLDTAIATLSKNDIPQIITSSGYQLYSQPDYPSEPGIIYRGLSSEELRTTLSTGVIQSRGDVVQNISVHSGLTFFSTNANEALGYGIGQAIPGYKSPTFEKPNYMIALKDPGNHAVEGNTEIGIAGPISKSQIIKIVEIKPVLITQGEVPLLAYPDGRVTPSSDILSIYNNPPRTSVAIKDVTKDLLSSPPQTP